jgi:hypothetical protein
MMTRLGRVLFLKNNALYYRSLKNFSKTEKERQTCGVLFLLKIKVQGKKFFPNFLKNAGSFRKKHHQNGKSTHQKEHAERGK